MVTDAKCSFEITGWDEKTYDEIEGSAKLTSAKVTQAYAGAIEGTGSLEYLMAYTVQGTAAFVGMERITGVVEGRSGTFVISHVGEFLDGNARSSWTILAGAGTGALGNLRGKGNYVAGSDGPAEVSFTYEFETLER
jgi:hypothetical protein